MYDAVLSQSASTSGRSCVSETANANEPVDAGEGNGADNSSSEPISKKQKLLMKHATSSGFDANGRLREEVKKYVAYKPSEGEDDPLILWKTGEFPLLEQVAKTALSQSASSVPTENMFSTMGLILDGKRSSLAPRTANRLSFIHDNYSMYFPTC